MGKWSEMSAVKMPDIECSECGEFVKMLSINVLEFNAMRVGLLIIGR